MGRPEGQTETGEFLKSKVPAYAGPYREELGIVSASAAIC